MEIRDPVHGLVVLSDAERVVVDSPWFQRLRGVRQLGFGDLVFPGGTHTRYLHSLGAMELATRIFDAVTEGACWLSGAERARLRQALRLAALLHDLGHPPLSHAAERLLPPASEVVPDCRHGRPATHEEMGRHLLMQQPLAAQIDGAMASVGVDAQTVAAVLAPEAVPDAASRLRAGGRNLAPLLSQIVASELDADRMDYLLRDSYFTGVSYGRYDLDWLLRGLRRHEIDGHVHLALDRSAVWTFEHFLLARYHMFLMVYFHRRTHAYDRMLERFADEQGGAVRLPADPEAFAGWDDARLQAELLDRAGTSRWARGIVRRQPLRCVLERRGDDAQQAVETAAARLQRAGIEVEVVPATGVLSRYLGKRRAGRPPMYVLDPTDPGEGAVPLERTTRLFERYAEPARIVRLYVWPDDVARACDVLGVRTRG